MVAHFKDPRSPHFPTLVLFHSKHWQKKDPLTNDVLFFYPGILSGKGFVSSLQGYKGMAHKENFYMVSTKKNYLVAATQFIYLGIGHASA